MYSVCITFFKLREKLAHLFLRARDGSKATHDFLRLELAVGAGGRGNWEAALFSELMVGDYEGGGNKESSSTSHQTAGSC